jgi:hypothetical protein
MPSPPPSAILCSQLGRHTTSSRPTGVFTKLGYPSLDTAVLSEITSAIHESDMVIMNIASATAQESLNRTIPGLLP